MSRVPLNEEVVEGEDTTEPEFTQVAAEGEPNYEPLDFDVVERYVEGPVADGYPGDQGILSVSNLGKPVRAS